MTLSDTQLQMAQQRSCQPRSLNPALSMQNRVPVFVRMRPALPHEEDESQLVVESGRILRAGNSSGEDVLFEGNVFGPEHSSSDMYTPEMQAGIESVCSGLRAASQSSGRPLPASCALLIYGNQASGKTYTLLGDEEEGRGGDARAAGEALDPSAVPSHGTRSDQDGAGSTWADDGVGLAHLCLETLFENVEALRMGPETGDVSAEEDAVEGDAGVHAYVTLSFAEIYQEVCSDLLEPSRVRLPVVEDPLVGVKVRGLSEKRVHSPSDCLAVIRQALRRRFYVQLRTDQERASRATTIIRLTVYVEPPAGRLDATAAAPPPGARAADGRLGSRSASLFLVDLASAAASNCADAHLHRSLYTLRLIVGRLSRRAKRLGKEAAADGGAEAAAPDDMAARLPYRDSKLTRLLRNSLGGSGALMLVCCIAPGPASDGEQGTLAFAAQVSPAAPMCPRP